MELLHELEESYMKRKSQEFNKSTSRVMDSVLEEENDCLRQEITRLKVSEFVKCK